MDGKEDIKLLWLAEDVIVYGGNLKELTKILLEVMSITFLDTNHGKVNLKLKTRYHLYYKPQNEILRYKSNKLCIRSI